MTRQNYIKAKRFCTALKSLGGRAKADAIAREMDKKKMHVAQTIRYELTPQFIEYDEDPITRERTYFLNGTGERLVEGR